MIIVGLKSLVPLLTLAIMGTLNLDTPTENAGNGTLSSEKLRQLGLLSHNVVAKQTLKLISESGNVPEAKLLPSLSGKIRVGTPWMVALRTTRATTIIVEHEGKLGGISYTETSRSALRMLRYHQNTLNIKIFLLSRSLLMQSP